MSNLTSMSATPSDRALWSRRQALLACLAIFAAWAVAAAIWPLTGMVVPWDSKNHFYPMLRYLGEALAHGELPLWNPYHFSGHPSVADPQSLLFTPTMVLFGWLVPQPSMQLFDAVVFAHLLPGALAFVPLFRRRGWAPGGRRRRGDGLHARRLCDRPPPAYRHHLQLRLIPACPLASRRGPRTALLQGRRPVSPSSPPS